MFWTLGLCLIFVDFMVPLNQILERIRPRRTGDSASHPLVLVIGGGTQSSWEEMTMKQLALCRDARTVVSAACLALVAAGGIPTPSKADDSVRSSPPDTNSYSRPVVAEDFDPLSTAGKAEAGRAVQFDVFVVDTVVNNTDPDLKITDTFNVGEISIAVTPRRHPVNGCWRIRGRTKRCDTG
jgi:hypothetical protein